MIHGQPAPSRSARGGLVWSNHDRFRWMTRLALGFAPAAAALWVFGIPPVDIHGPLHYAGIMDPLCGATRATYLLLSGDIGAAALYNPGVFVIAAVVLAILVRGAVGKLTGRWFGLVVGARWRRILLVVFVAAVLMLWIRQQVNADLLMAPWPPG